MKQRFLNWFADYFGGHNSGDRWRIKKLEEKCNSLEYDIRVVVLNPSSSRASGVIGGIKFTDAVERNVWSGTSDISNSESMKQAIGIMGQIKNK